MDNRDRPTGGRPRPAPPGKPQGGGGVILWIVLLGGGAVLVLGLMAICGGAIWLAGSWRGSGQPGGSNQPTATPEGIQLFQPNRKHIKHISALWTFDHEADNARTLLFDREQRRVVLWHQGKGFSRRDGFPRLQEGVSLYDLETGKQRTFLDLTELAGLGKHAAMDVSPSGALIAYEDKDGTVTVGPLDGGPPVITKWSPCKVEFPDQGGVSHVYLLRFLTDHRLLTIDKEDRLEVWQLPEGRSVYRQQLPPNPGNRPFAPRQPSLQIPHVSPNRKIWATNVGDGIEFRDATNFEVRARVPLERAAAQTLWGFRFSPDNGRLGVLLNGGPDGRPNDEAAFLVWDCQTGRRLSRHVFPNRLALSFNWFDSRRVLLGAGGFAPRLFDPERNTLGPRLALRLFESRHEAELGVDNQGRLWYVYQLYSKCHIAGVDLPEAEISRLAGPLDTPPEKDVVWELTPDGIAPAER